MLYNTVMPKGNEIKQTDETDIVKLAAMATHEIASGKVVYVMLEKGRKAELQKILMWIVAHSPAWRSKGSDKIREEMRRLGLWGDES